MNNTVNNVFKHKNGAKLNNTVNNVFKHKNGAAQYTYIKVGRNKSYFINDPLNGDNKYTATDISKMSDFFVDNRYVRFGGQLFEQTVGIPMGTNCALLLVDLLLYSCENEFLDKLMKEGKGKLSRKFSFSYRYIDNFISFNNKRFKEFIFDIYPNDPTIFEIIGFTSVASYLGLLFSGDENNNITTKLYDKCDEFRFHTFPLCQAIFHQDQPTVSMHLSSFAICCCSNYSDFLSYHKILVIRLLSQGYKVNCSSNTFKKFYG